MSQALQPYDGAVGEGAPYDELRSLLVAGEDVVACALQHRLYALVHRRRVVAATTGRIIFMTRPLLGGYEPTSIRWQDLKAVDFSVGMFTAAVTITYSANLSDTSAGEDDMQTLRVNGLVREPAAALYRVAQGQEQSWREKRRVRTLEEMRAQAGGVQVATGLYPAQTQPNPPIEITASDDPAARLARAKAMLDQRLITDAEYEAIKAKIVGSL